jgi:5-methylcytosine-specific restriction endonuclease McrA
MTDYFITDITAEEIRRERNKGRDLRRSRWWQNRLARGICHYGTFPPDELTMDHLVPVTRGGKSTPGNVVPACRDCNSRKKYLLPIEWEEYINKG